MGAISHPFRPHRRAAAADASNPTLRAGTADDPPGTVPEGADGSTPLPTAGQSHILFALRLEGVGSSITVQPMLYEAERQRFYADLSQAQTYNAPGDYLFEAKTRGFPVWCKITDLTGVDALAVIEYSMVRVRTIS